MICKRKIPLEMQEEEELEQKGSSVVKESSYTKSQIKEHQFYWPLSMKNGS